MQKTSPELACWKKVRECIGNERIELGPCLSHQLRNAPRRTLFDLSHCKFAAKMLGSGKEILEVGCSEGFGTIVLAEFAKRVVAIDMDAEAVEDAKRNFGAGNITFRAVDILGARIGKFDACVSFDVIEHIYPKNEKLFFRSICDNLKKQSVCIIGTPNKTSEKFAIKATRIGHVNMYTWDRLKGVMEEYFQHVFMFSANDELTHTGFYPMAHYLIAMGVGKRK